jgi:hypothetical protein
MLIKQVDDDLKTFSRDTEGVAMEAELEVAEEQAGWTMTRQSLDASPEGISFCGLEIKKFDDGAMGSGIAIRQPRQIERLERLVAEIDQEREAASTAAAEGTGVAATSRDRDQVWLPVPANWSPVSSAEQVERADPDSYARYMGALMWMQQTMQHGPYTSLLSSTTGNPSQLDADFQEQLMRYYVGPAKELELRFYQGPAGFSRRQPIPLHLFSDVGDCRAKDGGLQKAYMLKMGPRGHPGGACIWRSKKTVLAESIAAGETEGFNDTMKVAVRGRMTSEEIAGMRKDPRITQPIIAQSPPPTEIQTSKALVDDCANRDGGVWDDSAVRVMTVRRFGPPVAQSATAATTEEG